MRTTSRLQLCRRNTGEDLWPSSVRSVHGSNFQGASGRKGKAATFLLSYRAEKERIDRLFPAHQSDCIRVDDARDSDSTNPVPSPLNCKRPSCLTIVSEQSVCHLWLQQAVDYMNIAYSKGHALCLQPKRQAAPAKTCNNICLVLAGCSLSLGLQTQCMPSGACMCPIHSLCRKTLDAGHGVHKPDADAKVQLWLPLVGDALRQSVVISSDTDL